MAEAAIAFLSERCCEWLSTEMLRRLHGYDIEDKVRSLQGKIDWLRAYLKDVDDRSIDNERAKLWVNTIRDIAYDAEDTVDDFIHKMSSLQGRPRFLLHISVPNICKDISKKMDDIILRLDETITNKSVFGIDSFVASTSHRGEKIPPVVEEHNVVGLVDDASMLAKQLTQGATSRSAVSIVGMGGVGKTTLAKKLYSNKDIKKQFDYHTWVYVSQDYSVREILKSIIKSIISQKKKDAESIEKITELRPEFPKQYLLEGNRELPVPDDVLRIEPRIKVEQGQRHHELLQGNRELPVPDDLSRRGTRIKYERQQHSERKRKSAVLGPVLRREPRIKVEQQELLEGKRESQVLDDVLRRESRIKVEQQELLEGKRELPGLADALRIKPMIKVEQGLRRQELFKGKGKSAVRGDVLRRGPMIKVERRQSQKEILEGKRELAGLDDVLSEPSFEVERIQGQQEIMEGNGILMALREMKEIKGWFESLDKMSVDELREKLHELLDGKSYFVVLDDMWQKEAWDSLAAAFPIGQIRSRILLTTRNRDVALHADAQGFLHDMRFLSEANSWKLFCSKAFVRDSTHTCPANLENYGRQIVAKCGGLPLAIIMLGGLLSTKGNHPFDWAKVLKRVHWHLREGQNQIAGILALSYYDLPYHLKSCFMYLGAFPEDSEIRSSTLIKLWVAEGFIPKRGDEIIEDTAEDCLNELVSRSMVQMAKTNSYGAVKTCRVHDLLRDLSITKSKEEKFLEHYVNVEPNSCTKPRRLAVAHQDLNVAINDNCTTKHLRSFLQFQTQAQKRLSTPVLFLTLLTVLNLDSVNFSSTNIDDIATFLVHLRYLGLRNSRYEHLPRPMINLYNLQTLDVRNSNKMVLPKEIRKLKRLRHLRTENIQFDEPEGAATVLPLEPFGHAQIDNLNLQTLTGVRAEDWVDKGLEKLTCLTKLSMSGDFSPYSNFFSNVEFGCLKSLKLIANNNIDGSIPSLSCFSHNHHLYSMHLRGPMEMESRPRQTPPNLSKLTLVDSCLDQQLLATIEMLQNLRILTMGESSYIENEMVFSARGFPSLQVLRLHDLEEPSEWIVEEGAMPALRRLEICSCRHLRSLPEGLQRLTNLQELKIRAPSHSLKLRLKEDDGDDWYKIRHVPSIDIRSSL